MGKHSVYHIPGKIIRLGNSVKEFRNRHFQELGLTSAQADALFFSARAKATDSVRHRGQKLLEMKENVAKPR